MAKKQEKSTKDWEFLGEKDPPVVYSDWSIRDCGDIEGVVAKEIKSVPTGNGALTEMYRADWGMDELPVRHIFQRSLEQNALTAWHVHALATDRLFCAQGRIKLALYDGRKSSSTHGNVWQRIIGQDRPVLVVIPPGVWHGVKSLSAEKSYIFNAVDLEYDYDNPDHWRVPPDTDKIPKVF